MNRYRNWIVGMVLVLAVGVGGCFDEKADSQPVVSDRVAENTTKQEVSSPIKMSERTEYGDMILIEKSTFTLYLYKDGKEVAAYPCSLGKNQGQKQVAGDMKTPTGEFYIDEIIDASSWTHDFHDGRGEVAGAYGPWFLSLDTSELSKGAWNGIGIHGTCDPETIGTRASEGCIRLYNDDIESLKKQVKVGTKVKIVE